MPLDPPVAPRAKSPFSHKSTLTPRVGETLTARDVERLIVDRQMEVLIDLPRNGR